jgi:RND family efflux transporter MFP subunit
MSPSPVGAQSRDIQLSNDLQSLRIDRSGMSVGGKSRWGKPLAVVGVIAIVALAATAAKPLFAGAIAEEVQLTEISSVSPSQASVEVTSTGYVIPQVTAKVGSKIAGRIAKVNIREGMSVKAGAVLFELDPSSEKSLMGAANARASAAGARVQTAKASLAEAEVQLKRQETLLASGSVPKATVDDLTSRVSVLRETVRAQQAEANAQAAELGPLAISLQNTSVTAPINGTAVTKPAELGDIANPAAPLLELVDFSSLVVETDVPEARLAKIKLGGPVEIALDAIEGQRFSGTVWELGPRINRAKATGTVKVKFASLPTEVRPEMSARVSFLRKALSEEEKKLGERLLVPSNAIASEGGEDFVWVYEGQDGSGKVRREPVKLGDKVGDSRVLLSGPSAGTKIVASPTNKLASAKRVKEAK